MENPQVRKTRRALTLAKPAPRKNCLNKGPCTVMTAGTNSVSTDVTSHEKQDKENTTFKKRASRGLKLEKPAPLKSSKIINNTEFQTGKHAKVGSNYQKQKEDVMMETGAMSNRDNDFHMSNKPAKLKANLLIKEALTDLEANQQDANPPKTIQRQTKLLSQVSDDSGLGDMSAYSRQGSLLERFTEKPDEIDLNSLENTSTFTFGQHGMSCLPLTVNQAVLFNNFMTMDDIAVQGVCGENKGQQKLSQLDTRNYTRKLQFFRSNSVPSNLSRSKEKECWENKVELLKNNVLEVETVKRNNIEGNGDDEYGKLLDKHCNRTKTNHSNDTDSVVVTPKHAQHSNPYVFLRPSMQVTEDWEPEIIEIQQNQGKIDKLQNIRPIIPSNVKTTSGTETYSAIFNNVSVLDATPKAYSVLPRYKDFDLSVKRFEKSESDLAELYWESHSSAERDLKKENNASSVILNDWDVFSEDMKSLSSYQIYKEKNDNYLTSSSRTSTEADDVTSAYHSDDGLSEQMYAWELIEDLSVKVDSLKLDNMSPERGDRVEQNKVQNKVDLLPEDINDIGAEVQCMREDFKLFESLKSDKARFCNLVLKSEINAIVHVTREPLSPYSTQEDMWRVEEGMSTRFGSSLSRRKMFRYFKQSQQEEKGKVEKLIQYTVKELLEIGASALSKRKLESWSLPEHLYPQVCLKKRWNFDTLSYLQEREYVCEIQNAENIDKQNSIRRKNSRLPDVTRHPRNYGVNSCVFGALHGGFGVPQGGFGAPESGHCTPKNGFGLPQGGHGAPQNRFGASINKFQNHVKMPN